MKAKSSLWAVSCVLLLATVRPGFAGVYDVWHWRNPLPQGRTLRAAAFGAGTFVAVGDGGAVVTSTNGVDWEALSVDPARDFTGVAYGNGLFAATSRDQVFTSLDGVTWLPQRIGDGGSLYAITFGHDRFVAVGAEDFFRHNVFLSTNGLDWEARGVRTTALSLRAVAGGDSGFAIVGDRAWGAFSDPEFQGSSSGELLDYWPLAILGVAANGNQFVAVGDQGTIATARPFDPSPHRWSSNIHSGTTETLTAVDFAGSQFVAVGGRGVILTSDDGESWLIRRQTSGPGLFGVAHGLGLIVAVGADGVILTSPDGIDWTPRNRGETGFLSGVARWKDAIVAVGQAGTILTSTDGKTWTPQHSGTAMNLTGIAVSGSLLVSTGNEGTILTSTDGAQWTLRHQIAGQTLNRVIYGEGQFVAVGSQWDAAHLSRAAQILVSADGSSWEQVFTIPDCTFEDVAYGNGILVAVGTEERRGVGLVVTSPDALSWIGFVAAGLASYPVSLRGAAFGNGRFVVVGNGFSLTSRDGQDWTIPGQPVVYFAGVRFAAGTFVATDQYGEIGVSADGVNWTLHATGSDQAVADLLDFKGTILTVGSEAHILQSDPVVLLGLGLGPGSPGRLQISGPIGATVHIESATDLLPAGLWTPVDTVMLDKSPFGWSDARPANSQRQFYRTVMNP